MEALLLLVSQLAVSAEHDLEMAREIFFAEHFGNAGDALALFARNLQQERIFAGNFCDGGVPQESDQLAGEVRWAVALADKVVDLTEDFFAPAFVYRLHHLFQT